MIKRLGRYQVYVERSKQYVGTLTLFIKISLFISINVGLELLWWQYLVVFVLAPIIFLVFGYLDVKIGVMSQVQKFQGDKNPIFNEFFARLERIEKEIKKL